MLTVEMKNGEEAPLGKTEVEVYCDSEGLELLLAQLQHLKDGSRHIHLMTSSWAGNELDEVKHGAGNTVINHLKVILLPS